MSAPKISVITPAYNAAPYLRALIESVLQQDYPYYEHIVIDDGSTDDGATVRILEDYSHLRWWSHANRGQYATQNDGLMAARGEIISVISADDVYAAPTVFSQVVQSWEANPGCNLIYGRTLYMNEYGQFLPDMEVTGRFPKFLIRSFLYVQHCSLFVQRELIRSHEIWFDSNLKYTGDWDWIIRLFNAAQEIRYLPQPLSIVRRHAQQTSRKAPSQAMIEEHQRILGAYNGHRSLYAVITYFRQYRAMALLGLHILKTQGMKALFGRFQDWLGRRTKPVKPRMSSRS